MRAALYARVSSEELEGYSIDAQRRNYHTLVQGRGWESVAEYIEGGRSARHENINGRPRFKEAIEDGLRGKYDVLVVDKLDRFARRLMVTLEFFSKLSTAGRSFVSIREQIDFTTPFGKVALAVLGALAEWYSDNLSEETRKGKQERKAQGLYNGSLPFGAMKGEDGVPLPDTREVRVQGEDGTERVIQNYNGFRLIFEKAAMGYSDREVALMLNARGYRTMGVHGSNLFTKDTVKGIRKNRFYLGELPDGQGGSVRGRHQPLIPAELFRAAQRQRAMTIRSDFRPCSLSGVARCAACGGTMRTCRSRDGRVRLECANELRHKSRQEYLADYAAIQRELEALPDATADSEELEKLASFLRT